MQSSRSMLLAFMLRDKKPRIKNTSTSMKLRQVQQQRFMVGRASDRSGVHGSHLPSVDVLDDEVEKEINKGKKDKESKRKHVEDTVDSHLKSSYNQDPKSPPNQH